MANSSFLLLFCVCICRTSVPEEKNRIQLILLLWKRRPYV
uniref:Uncharacterized protein n=1 Tax=Arundo donax TaxID=35708 RepID=A0A0A9HPV8_ARUDO